ncbi:ABC transporter substrate-binding protein [Bradyrhizobium sp. INPA03-11B]|uniref:ABC transporter substrate-binding protein n=1 Tax=Bradyrhizobium sp. INPA03-11B TaxID=418598 RepID=UPI00338E48B1
MRRRDFIAACIGGVVAASSLARAQKSGKVARLGLLLPFPAVNSDFAQYFRGGMRELGWEEGKNWVFETRAYWRDLGAVPGCTEELIRAKVDIIIVVTLQVALAARPVAGDTPILVAVAGDPVRVGAAESLAHPGGTITGLATMSPELATRRVQQLREILPGATRLALLGEPGTPLMPLMLDAILPAARSLGFVVRVFDVREPEGFKTSFETMRQWSADAVIVLDSEMFWRNGPRLAAAATAVNMPMACGFREMTRAGCLFSYATNIREHFRRGATYVDKLLKGVKPGDLPFEQPTRFELIINLKTARQLGVTIPDTLLTLADEVIE